MKKIGDSHFAEKRFSEALRFYNRAVRLYMNVIDQVFIAMSDRM